MDLINRFKEYIEQHNLFNIKDKLLLAVSGGVDSVVLCELCRQAGFKFSIAHCNFQLRGDDSVRDENFVKELAEKLGAAFYSVRFDTKRIARERKIAIQEAARELRYHWFDEIRTAGSYNYIATAHHADDNIETILMNFFRGTGIKGLKGMDPKHGFIVRPLLFAGRSELELFVAQLQLKYVLDSSNLEDDYTRNYFRNQVIPLITKSFPEARENVLGNISRFREAWQLYMQAIQMHKKNLFEIKGDEVHIAVLKLKKTEPLQTILYEIIRDFGFKPHQANEVISLLDSDTGKYVQSSSHRIIRNRNWLNIVPNNSKDANTFLIKSFKDHTACPGLQIQFSILAAGEQQPLTGRQVACLDADEITFPLLLRKWKQGDYFYPLGMNKKKKLSRFFIDQKLSRSDKEKVWVLEMNKKIIWVVDYRIDNRFKVTGKTKSILKIVASTVQTG